MESNNERPEIWAGIECTINRLNTGYSDQLELSGHYDRENDLDAIADLGIKSIRYPILWEKHQPEKNGKIDFTWAQGRLTKLQKLNITPIIGLLHHGSGPEYTNLLDPAFPQLFAAYAKEVALRFPTIDRYTPVNEPLTTARFSGLYGHWYPHERNDVSFVKMLINELKATVLAMTEIRKINPNALLVQTEDLGKTYSTELLQYQATMENHRRFLTYDILCGKLNEEHPLWEHFMHLGILHDELQFFIENPCPPDILGVNYYVTSERFLDHNLNKYPSSTHGGNSIHQYADVEAVRVRFKEPHGFPVLIRELWQRYKIPIAVTEAHLHCSREEQMKWFLEIYENSTDLLKEGIKIIAVTAWSVLGAFGWNRLLTCSNMDYERGTFDVSSGTLRPTALATLIKTLAQSGSYTNPVLNGQGWWNCETRYLGAENKPRKNNKMPPTCKPILILGKNGTLGKAFAKICEARSVHHILLSREDLDICIYGDIENSIKKYQPWAIINAAGFVNVDAAESNQEKCFRENTTGALQLATACKNNDVRFLTFSTDLVFDGKKAKPYLESDNVNPLNVYGESKARAESSVSTIYPESLIIRTSAFFGPWDHYNFIHSVLKTLEDGNTFVASDAVISPTYVPHLVNASLDLLIDSEKGIWHLTNNDPVSWYDFARQAAIFARLNPDLIIKANPDRPACIPSYSVLQTEKGNLMPSLQNALHEYFMETLVLA